MKAFNLRHSKISKSDQNNQMGGWGLGFSRERDNYCQMLQEVQHRWHWFWSYWWYMWGQDPFDDVDAHQEVEDLISQIVPSETRYSTSKYVTRYGDLSTCSKHDENWEEQFFQFWNLHNKFQIKKTLKMKRSNLTCNHLLQRWRTSKKCYLHLKMFEDSLILEATVMKPRKLLHQKIV